MLLLLGLLATAPACDAVWHDTARGRDLPVRITLPVGSGRVPVVLWSPGLGGDSRGGTRWVRAWATAGIATVQIEHPGSAAAVYRPGGTPEERRARVIEGSSPIQFLARVGDARFVLSEVGRRPAEGGCDLARIDTDRAAIAGHSMGAWVAQALAGQRFATPGGGPEADAPLLRDQRFRAAIAFSPTAAPGTDAFRRVAIPVLAITGSRDGVASGADAATAAAALAARTAVYHSLPADGRKCLLVVEGAEHMMFAGNRAPEAEIARRAEMLSLAATTTFLAAALRPDPPERITLDLKGGLAADDLLACK